MCRLSRLIIYSLYTKNVYLTYQSADSKVPEDVHQWEKLPLHATCYPMYVSSLHSPGSVLKAELDVDTARMPLLTWQPLELHAKLKC